MLDYYFCMTLQAWEEIAHSACFATDVKLKFESQQHFLHFFETVNIDILTHLLNCGSDTLLFVLFSYLSKNPRALNLDMQKFTCLLQVIKGWQFKGFTFIRNNLAPLQKFVVKTLMLSLGIILKTFYQQAETSNILIKYLEQMQNNYFKLFMLQTFVEGVETIDTEMGYMRYRTMVYSFQDNVIPMICETLMPYFYNVEEGVRICELSHLQGHLKVNENEQLRNNLNLQISHEQQIHSEQIFLLLRKIVEFNYNITYTQYESEQAIETCLITFPDRILQKLINHEFIDALFFLIEKVADVKAGQKKKEYLLIGLDCLSKLLQSKLSYVSQQNKQAFLLHSINGLTLLLRKCKQIGSQLLLQGILNCNKKLFISIQICYIKRIVEKYPQFMSINLYKIYLTDLTDMIAVIIKNSFINIQNHLLLESLEVGNKLINSYGYKDQQNIDQEYLFFMKFICDVINYFITALCLPKCIFSGTKIISLSENKQSVNQIFDLFKKMASYSYATLFEKLTEALNYFLDSETKNETILANILFLLSEIIDHHYLERNIYLNKAKDKQLLILAKLVNKATIVVQQYIKSLQFMRVNNHNYLDIATIIFIEAVLLQFMVGLEGRTQFKIKQKLYLLMQFEQNYHNYVELQDDKSEETIIMYINCLFAYLNVSITNKEDQAKIFYVMDAIQKCILKLKWSMRRECFLKSQIFKLLSNYFQNFFYNYKGLLDVRSRAGKIMVTLTFQDVQDEYKYRINTFLSILKTQELEVILYDLIGIFEGIETNAISKYFCNKLKKQFNLKQFFNNIFLLAINKNQQKLNKDICKLCKLMLTNKGLKVSNCIIIYQLFEIILPNLNFFLKKMNQLSQFNFDLWGEALYELIDLFCGVITSNQVNIFLLDHSTTNQNDNNSVSLIKQYIVELFKVIWKFSSQLKNYPKMEESILTLVTSVNKQILEYIYSDETELLSHSFNLIMIIIIDNSIHYIHQLLGGNKIMEDRLIKNIDCLRVFYFYFNKKCRMIHKVVILSNLKKYYELTQNHGERENKNQKLIFYLICFILTNFKNNISYLRTIVKLIYQLNKNFTQFIRKAFQLQKIEASRLTQLDDILIYLKDKEQLFIQHFKTWIKNFKQFK